ncbi:MAG: ABC transporter ATP-binding protein [Anaerolineaceae bacterium]|nr:ABC transporter ATP-binding protein [Anaerolineaceae bacterium]
MTTDKIPLLEMREITKRFPGILANDHINFSVYAGEIHSLLGENGAGKSTLMNILYGLVAPDSGKVFVRGKEVRIHSPLDAIDKGIGMVHQHFMLVDRLSVVENVVIGTKPPGYPAFRKEAAVKRISQLIEEYGFDIDALMPVHLLSVGQQQRVEIIKALYRGADLLILDEPTAVLTPPEVVDLFRLLRNLRQAGHGIIFISHKLNETLENSDQITVIRQGKVVNTVLPQNIDRAGLASLMVGRDVLFDLPHPPYSGKQHAVLNIQNLKVLDDRKIEAVKDISIEVCNGEVFGIAGVDGNGQSELVEALTGLRQGTGGKIMLGGVEITGKSPGEILAQGVAHIPEDRQVRGLVMGFRVDENLILHDYGRPPFTRRGLLQHKEIYRWARQRAQDFDIRPPEPRLQARQLSGGNQQKVVLARELTKNPRLIIAVPPTRGLDVGATEYVHRALLDARANGAAVLLVSTELEEVLSLSDTVAVMYEGRIVGTMQRDEIDITRIGLLMGGGHVD